MPYDEAFPEDISEYQEICQNYRKANNLQCAFPLTKEKPESAFYSDSGSPLVGVKAEESFGLYTQYGIVLGGENYHHLPGKPITTLFLDLRNYLKDFCYYLNLCLPNVKKNGHFLFMNSIYIRGK